MGQPPIIKVLMVIMHYPASSCIMVHPHASSSGNDQLAIVDMWKMDAGKGYNLIVGVHIKPREKL